jgi:general secretion pathway protein C
MARSQTLSAVRTFNLRRAIPLVVVLAVISCAYFQARALNALLSSWLLGSLVRPFVSPPDPQREPKRKVTPPSAIALGTLVPSPGTEILLDCSDVRLSIVSELSNPEDSLATLTMTGDSRATPRRRGDRLGNRLVAWIGTESSSLEPAVWLKNERSTELCRVDLFRPRGTTKAALTAAELNPGAGPAPPSATLAPTEAPSAQTPSLRQLLGPVRGVPELEAGKPVGLRLFGVRPGSLLMQIGLRSGDRIDSINGYSIAEPEQALLAYARLRDAEHFKLRVIRSGQPLELDYELTGSLRRQLVTLTAPN